MLGLAGFVTLIFLLVIPDPNIQSTRAHLVLARRIETEDGMLKVMVAVIRVRANESVKGLSMINAKFHMGLYCIILKTNNMV
ncbi:MAG: hypothetical protein WA323_24050 [Candidatus Nitrosopolaris sp.]|jgi:hypothetical protein